MFPLLSGTSAYHLPPVKAPTCGKKSSKHCFLCGKKTGLATSYECRYKCLQHLHLHSLTHSLSDSKPNLSLFVILVLEAKLLVESSLLLVHHFVSAISPMKTRLCSLLVLPHIFNIIKVSPCDIHLNHFPLSGLVQDTDTKSDATVCNSNLLKPAT